MNDFNDMQLQRFAQKSILTKEDAKKVWDILKLSTDFKYTTIEIQLLDKFFKNV